MSSPMFDLPEHCPIPVNSQGQGPEDKLEDIAWWLCWCSDPQCLLFQVSGDDYRKAIKHLEGGEIPDARRIVGVMIGLGWTKTGEGL